MVELVAQSRGHLNIEPLPTYASEVMPEEQLWTWLEYDRLCNFALTDARQLNEVVVEESEAIRDDQSMLRTFLSCFCDPLATRITYLGVDSPSGLTNKPASFVTFSITTISTEPARLSRPNRPLPPRTSASVVAVGPVLAVPIGALCALLARRRYGPMEETIRRLGTPA
jgi:hypothetical protein